MLACSDDGVQALAAVPADPHGGHTRDGKPAFQALSVVAQLAHVPSCRGVARLKPGLY